MNHWSKGLFSKWTIVSPCLVALLIKPASSPSFTRAGDTQAARWPTRAMASPGALRKLTGSAVTLVDRESGDIVHSNVQTISVRLTDVCHKMGLYSMIFYDQQLPTYYVTTVMRLSYWERASQLLISARESDLWWDLISQTEPLPEEETQGRPPRPRQQPQQRRQRRPRQREDLS